MIDSEKKQNKRQYTWIQWFFWVISGSEISILKDCPADYNRYAAIGFTIFMTTVFASFAGGYAGYFFSGETWVAIVFGLIWGALVFSIDRSMVISLKKDPNKTKQKFLIPFLSRALLGGIIAFIIAIPLEIKIFEETIRANDADYKKDKILTLLDKAKREQNIEGLESNINSSVSERALADSLLKMDEPNSGLYITRKKEFLELKSKYALVKQQHKDIMNERKKVKETIPMLDLDQDGSFESLDKKSAQYKNYGKLSLAAYNKDKEILDTKKELDEKTEELALIREEWIAENEYKKQQADSAVSVYNKQKLEANTKIISERNSQDALIKDMNGFVTQFEILSYAASKPENYSVLMLIWFIRVLFFLIEILPTISKLSTPPGQYDFALYRRERDFIEITLHNEHLKLRDEGQQRKILDQKLLEYSLLEEERITVKVIEEVMKIKEEVATKTLAELADTLETYNKRVLSQVAYPQNATNDNHSYKVKKESELNNKIIDKVTEIQERLAMEKLQEYENKERSRINNSSDWS